MMLINKTRDLKDNAADELKESEILVMTVGNDIAKFVKAFPDRFLTC